MKSFIFGAIVVGLMFFGLKCFAQSANAPSQQSLQDAYDVAKAQDILTNAQCVQRTHAIEKQEQLILTQANSFNIEISK